MKTGCPTFLMWSSERDAQSVCAMLTNGMRAMALLANHIRVYSNGTNGVVHGTHGHHAVAFDRGFYWRQCDLVGLHRSLRLASGKRDLARRKIGPELFLITP